MKKKTGLVVGFALAILLSSCGNAKNINGMEPDKVQSFNLNDTISLNMNDLAICEQNHNLFIQFDTVFSDSRCPIDADCIWEGNAEVGFSLTLSKQLEKIKLNTNPKNGTKVTFENYEINLIELNPYPGSENAENIPVSSKIIIKQL